MKKMISSTIVLLCLLYLVPNLAFGDGDVCSDPANLTFNCDMNTFSDHSSPGQTRVVADGWWFWVESGNPAIDQGQDSPVPPSQRIWSDGGNFRAGIYQVVRDLTPGTTYIAGVGWVPYTAPSGSIMRQIGLDPMGGTDPNGPNVVWGPEDWKFSRFTNLEVRAVAASSEMTLFIRIYNPASHGADQVFIDGAWLKQDTSVPARPVATPTLAPSPTATPPPGPTPIPATARDCLFFDQTGGGKGGYSVCDNEQARFRTAFETWGLQKIGYPISRRYWRDGFMTQAFQKAMMQWRPESGSVVLVNIFDDLHNQGYDDTLLATRQTPKQLPAGWDGDRTFDEIVVRRQGLLDIRPALSATYFASNDPLTFYGLPTSEIQDMGNHYAIRLQRAVLQEWKEDVPWARLGEVTIANGGDIAKELGALPAGALVPESGLAPSP